MNQMIQSSDRQKTLTAAIGFIFFLSKRYKTRLIQSRAIASRIVLLYYIVHTFDKVKELPFQHCTKVYYTKVSNPSKKIIVWIIKISVLNQIIVITFSIIQQPYRDTNGAAQVTNFTFVNNFSWSFINLSLIVILCCLDEVCLNLAQKPTWT